MGRDEVAKLAVFRTAAVDAIRKKELVWSLDWSTHALIFEVRALAVLPRVGLFCSIREGVRPDVWFRFLQEEDED